MDIGSLDNSGNDHSSDGSDESEDWYNSSDTSDEIPDPNLSQDRTKILIAFTLRTVALILKKVYFTQ